VWFFLRMMLQSLPDGGIRMQDERWRESATLAAPAHRSRISRLKVRHRNMASRTVRIFHLQIQMHFAAVPQLGHFDLRSSSAFHLYLSVGPFEAHADSHHTSLTRPNPEPQAIPLRIGHANNSQARTHCRKPMWPITSEAQSHDRMRSPAVAPHTVGGVSFGQVMLVRGTQ
jgi:hypothetical protein